MKRKTIPMSIALVALALFAGVAQADVKVRKVTLKVETPPQIELPEKVKNIGLVSFTAGKEVKEVLPPAEQIFKAVLLETLLKRAKKFKVIDRENLDVILKENPDAKLAAVHLILMGNLTQLKATPFAEGKKIKIHFAVSVRAILMESAEILFSKNHAGGSIHEVQEGEDLRKATHRATVEAFREFAAGVALMIAGESKSEEALLLEAGPLTAAAIGLAKGGDLKGAEAMFKRASESEAERNSGFFGLYALAKFRDEEAKARGYLKKAGE